MNYGENFKILSPLNENYFYYFNIYINFFFFANVRVKRKKRIDEIHIVVVDDDDDDDVVFIKQIIVLPRLKI